MDAPRPIMIHGTVGGNATWVGQQGAFAGAAAIALPGFPLGEAFDDRDAAVAFVADTARRVPGPRVLVGHELGAAMAIAACADAPDLAVGLVVSGLGVGAPPTAGDDVESVVGECLTETSGDVAALLRRVMEAVTPENRTRTRRLAAALDPTRAWRLGIPVLAVAAADDPRVTPHQMAALTGPILRGSGALVPGARHLVMADAGDAFNLLMAAFLARVEVDAGA